MELKQTLEIYLHIYPKNFHLVEMKEKVNKSFLICTKSLPTSLRRVAVTYICRQDGAQDREFVANYSPG
jgi:hypothetical protein